jgi:predicted site-specific integrase-resolvase
MKKIKNVLKNQIGKRCNWCRNRNKNIIVKNVFKSKLMLQKKNWIKSAWQLQLNEIERCGLAYVQAKLF